VNPHEEVFMAEDRYEGSSNHLLYFLLGGLAGAAVALLYAPRSGRETREMLGEKLREGADRGRELKEELVSRSREFIDEAGEYVEKQKDNLGRRRERLAAAIDAGRQAYRDEKEKM
jgi:gas vesicle protein